MNICEALERIRPIGKVTCATFHGSQITDRKSQTKKLGYRPLSDSFWIPISEIEAEALLVQSISSHIEDDERILDEDEVKPIIASFIRMFPKDTKFFTNFDGGFECISHSYLDIAVTMENENGVVGFVCIEDDQAP